MKVKHISSAGVTETSFSRQVSCGNRPLRPALPLTPPLTSRCLPPGGRAPPFENHWLNVYKIMSAYEFRLVPFELHFHSTIFAHQPPNLLGNWRWLAGLQPGTIFFLLSHSHYNINDWINPCCVLCFYYLWLWGKQKWSSCGSNKLSVPTWRIPKVLY